MTRGKKLKKKDIRKERKEGEKKNDIFNESDKFGDDKLISISAVFKNDELQEIKSILRVKDLDDAHTFFGAIVLGKFDIVKKLLREGYPIDCTDENGNTGTMWAVKSHQVEMVELLMRRGADILKEDCGGNTAFSLALMEPDWDQNIFIDFWNTIKDSGIDLNKPNKAGNTVVHLAVKRQWVAVLEVLLEAGANVDAVNGRGATGLMMAASRNYSHTLQILLYYNADYAIEDQRGCTAFCYSVAYMIKKKFDKPDTIIETLLASMNEDHARVNVDTYIKRRLDLLYNPSGKYFAQTVLAIVVHVITFFMRFMASGAVTFLGLGVFQKLKDAVDKHLEDNDYILSLLTVMVELLRICPCCMKHVPKEKVLAAFSDSGIPNVILKIIKRMGNNTTPGFLHAAFLPLTLTCSWPSITLWLQSNVRFLLPMYNRYIKNLPSPLYNYYPDETHSSLVRRAANEFKALVACLQNRKLTYKKIEKRMVATERYHLPEVVGIGDEENKLEVTLQQPALKTVKVERNNNDFEIGCLEGDLKSSRGYSVDPSNEVANGVTNKQVMEEETETYWPLKRNNHLDLANLKNGKKLRSKWQEDFKEGCELFGISTDIEEGDEATPNNLFELEIPPDNSNGGNSKSEESVELESMLNSFEGLLKDLKDRYEKVWQSDYEIGYPGAVVEVSDFMKLMTLLPGLEAAHMKVMDNNWNNIIEQVENLKKEKNTDLVKILKDFLKEYKNLEKQEVVPDVGILDKNEILQNYDPWCKSIKNNNGLEDFGGPQNKKKCLSPSQKCDFQDNIFAEVVKEICKNSENERSSQSAVGSASDVNNIQDMNQYKSIGTLQDVKTETLNPSSGDGRNVSESDEKQNNLSGENQILKKDEFKNEFQLLPNENSSSIEVQQESLNSSNVNGFYSHTNTNSKSSIKMELLNKDFESLLNDLSNPQDFSSTISPQLQLLTYTSEDLLAHGKDITKQQINNETITRLAEAPTHSQNTELQLLSISGTEPCPGNIVDGPGSIENSEISGTNRAATQSPDKGIILKQGGLVTKEIVTSNATAAQSITATTTLMEYCNTTDITKHIITDTGSTELLPNTIPSAKLLPPTTDEQKSFQPMSNIKMKHPLLIELKQPNTSVLKQHINATQKIKLQLIDNKKSAAADSIKKKSSASTTNQQIACVLCKQHDTIITAPAKKPGNVNVLANIANPKQTKSTASFRENFNSSTHNIVEPDIPKTSPTSIKTATLLTSKANVFVDPCSSTKDTIAVNKVINNHNIPQSSQGNSVPSSATLNSLPTNSNYLLPSPSLASTLNGQSTVKLSYRTNNMLYGSSKNMELKTSMSRQACVCGGTSKPKLPFNNMIWSPNTKANVCRTGKSQSYQSLCSHSLQDNLCRYQTSSSLHVPPPPGFENTRPSCIPRQQHSHNFERSMSVQGASGDSAVQDIGRKSKMDEQGTNNCYVRSTTSKGGHSSCLQDIEWIFRPTVPSFGHRQDVSGGGEGSWREGKFRGGYQANTHHPYNKFTPPTPLQSSIGSRERAAPFVNTIMRTKSRRAPCNAQINDTLNRDLNSRPQPTAPSRTTLLAYPKAFRHYPWKHETIKCSDRSKGAATSSRIWPLSVPVQTEHSPHFIPNLVVPRNNCALQEHMAVQGKQGVRYPNSRNVGPFHFNRRISSIWDGTKKDTICNREGKTKCQNVCTRSNRSCILDDLTRSKEETNHRANNFPFVFVGKCKKVEANKGMHRNSGNTQSSTEGSSQVSRQFCQSTEDPNKMEKFNGNVRGNRHAKWNVVNDKSQLSTMPQMDSEGIPFPSRLPVPPPDGLTLDGGEKRREYAELVGLNRSKCMSSQASSAKQISQCRNKLTVESNEGGRRTDPTKYHSTLPPSSAPPAPKSKSVNSSHILCQSFKATLQSHPLMVLPPSKPGSSTSAKTPPSEAATREQRMKKKDHCILS